MGKRIDRTGMVYGDLTVVRYLYTGKDRHAVWECRCICGNLKEVGYICLHMGRTRSCGCARVKHGMSEKRNIGDREVATYKSWKGIKYRCNNKDARNYSQYGGRGIKVCERWDMFTNFLLDMGLRPAGTTIDRIDVNGDYEPSNCRWATNKQQAGNKQDTIWVELDGKKICLAEACEQYGMNYSTVRQRLRYGVPLLESLIDKTDRRLAECSIERQKEDAIQKKLKDAAARWRAARDK